ncbi:hypothetical protein D3C87_1803200 [compost metagenome]
MVLHRRNRLPGVSGSVTASRPSRSSPISARSATNLSLSKFMLAPLRMATYVSPRVFRCLAYCFTAATASAPAGSTMLRVSVNTSLIAAQIESVSTVT